MGLDVLLYLKITLHPIYLLKYMVSKMYEKNTYKAFSLSTHDDHM
jgi:hypothetical protein